MADFSGLFDKPTTIFDSMNNANNMMDNIHRSQMLQQYTKQYPQLLQDQVGMANNGLATSNINLQYLPQKNQADIASKNAYANLIPFQAAASMDPVTKMWYYQNVIVPAIKSGNLKAYGNNGGMSAPPPQQPGISPSNLPITSNDNGVTIQPVGFSAPPVASPSVNNQLPVSLPPGAENQIAAAGAPSPSSAPQVIGSPTGAPNYDQLMATQLKNIISQTSKDPRTGTAKGGAGGTYVDPETGLATSSNTTQQSSRDQRTIAGLDNVNTYLTHAMQKMPQFITAPQRARVGLEGLSNNWLGTNYQGPSDLAAGKAAISEAAEGFINGFGLNATNENVNKAIDIMTPANGESPQGYKSRVSQQLRDFIEQANRAKGRLKSGTPLNQPKESTQDPLGLR